MLQRCSFLRVSLLLAAWLAGCHESPKSPPRTLDAAAQEADEDPPQTEEEPDRAPTDTRVNDAGSSEHEAGHADPVLDARADTGQLEGGADVLAPPAVDAGSPSDAGDYAIGTTRVEVTTQDARVLPLQLWYPAEESARAEANAGHDVTEFEPAGMRRDLITRLLTSAPAECTNRRMHAALDAPARAQSAPYPLLVYSHHNEGMRYALFTLAEQLARLGFVVVAPDHTELTLFDRTDDLSKEDAVAMSLRIRPDALAIRSADIMRVLDALLDASSEVLPSALRGKLDSARVGVFGHSMGSLTMGIVAQRDPRVRAAAYISFFPAALSPLLNLFDQPLIEDFRVPALFLLNQEDSALSAVDGANVVRDQFAAHPPAAWLVEVKDTGHWSFADDCALIPDFRDGCGQGMRSSVPNESYTSLNNELARASAARYLSAFFDQQLRDAGPGPLDGTAAAPYEVVRSHPALR